jgi:endonuclease YncB( thermonuclease family)
VFYGGGYYDYEAPPAPVGPYPPADYQIPSGYEQMTQPPVVIINQYFRPDAANPVIRDYSNVPLPESQREAAPQASEPQVMFLIAMKDHTIFPAVAYWVDGDTLNYITVQGSKNSASLDLVDREFSQQINKERRVEFGLPSSAR